MSVGISEDGALEIADSGTGLDGRAWVVTQPTDNVYASPWEDGIHVVSGLNEVAFCIPEIGVGGYVRWNGAVTDFYRAIVIAMGGGHALEAVAEPRDMVADSTDFASLQSNFIRVVSISWFDSEIPQHPNDGSPGPGAGGGREQRTVEDEVYTLADMHQRMAQVLQWIDDNLNPRHRPVVLIGSSGGADGMLAAFTQDTAMARRVKALFMVSYPMPFWDPYHMCIETTPAGTYVDYETGAQTNTPSDVGATHSGVNQVDDIRYTLDKCSLSTITESEAGPGAKSMLAAIPPWYREMLVCSIALGEEDFVTADGAWAAGGLFNCEFFKYANRVWRKSDTDFHGEMLTNTASEGFQFFYDTVLAIADAEMSFPQVRAFAGANSGGNVTTTTPGVDALSPVEGDLIVIGIFKDGTGAFTWPAGWVSLTGAVTFETTNQQGVADVRVRVRVAGDADPAITHASEGTAHQIFVISKGTWHGLRPTGVEGAAANGDSTNPNAPSLNPTNWDVEDTLWLLIAMNDGNVAITAMPAQFATGFQNDRWANAAGGGIASGRREAALASVDPGVCTMATEQWAAFTIAIRPCQQIEGQNIVSTQLFAPTLTYRVAGATLAGTVLFPPTVSPDQNVSGAVISATVLFAPTLTHVIAGATIAETQLFAPTIVLEQAIAGATISGTSVNPPTLAHALSTPSPVSATTLFPPTVDQNAGEQEVGGATIAGTTLGAPTLTHVVAGASIAGTTLFPPSVSPGAVTVSGATIATTSVNAPTLAHALALAAPISGTALFAPSVEVGAVSVTGASISATQVFAPSLAYQVAGATVSATQLFAPSVASGAIGITGSTIASTVLGAPVLAHAVSLPVLTSTQLGPPSVSPVTSVTGGTISSTSVNAPSLAYRIAGGTIAGTVLGPPTLTEQGAVALPTISSTVLFAPRLAYAIAGGTISSTSVNAPALAYRVAAPSIATTVLGAPSLAYRIVLPSPIAGTVLGAPSLAVEQAVSAGTVAATVLFAPTLAYHIAMGPGPSGTLFPPSLSVGDAELIGALISSTVLLPPGVSGSWLFGDVIRFGGLEAAPGPGASALESPEPGAGGMEAP